MKHWSQREACWLAKEKLEDVKDGCAEWHSYIDSGCLDIQILQMADRHHPTSQSAAVDGRKTGVKKDKALGFQAVAGLHCLIEKNSGSLHQSFDLIGIEKGLAVSPLGAQPHLPLPIGKIQVSF